MRKELFFFNEIINIMGIFDKFKKIFNENNGDESKKKKETLSSKKMF